MNRLFIEFFDIKTEMLMKEIDISHYELKKINTICPPDDPHDTEYTNSQYVTSKQFSKLKKYINEIRNMEENKYIINICTYRMN